jgi:SAM-dependent methyltransferase
MSFIEQIGARARDLGARAKSWVSTERDESGVAIPPGHLIHLVAGTTRSDWYLGSGKVGADTLADTLAKNGANIDDLSAILDFGCGVGRVLRFLPALTRARLYGCDYNPKLIAWCRRNLPMATFQTNNLVGRLAYDDNAFDLAYALSIFTHLTEAQHVFWINELRRVLKPGGYLFVTTHGTFYEPHIPADKMERYRAGELVVTNSEREGTNHCAAFHPEKYVREHLAKGWEIIDFIPQGARGNPSQDAWLLRKPMAG